MDDRDDKAPRKRKAGAPQGGNGSTNVRRKKRKDKDISEITLESLQGHADIELLYKAVQNLEHFAKITSILQPRTDEP